MRRLVASSFQSGLILFLEDRDHHFFRGAGVGRALENDQLSGAQMGSDGVGGVGDVAEVGLVIFVQRSGDADDDGVHRGELRVVGGRGEALCFGGLNLFRSDAVDVGTALGQRIDFAGIDVEAGHLKFLLAVQQSQRKADVAQADDADAGLALLNSGS